MRILPSDPLPPEPDATEENPSRQNRWCKKRRKLIFVEAPPNSGPDESPTERYASSTGSTSQPAAKRLYNKLYCWLRDTAYLSSNRQCPGIFTLLYLLSTKCRGLHFSTDTFILLFEYIFNFNFDSCNKLIYLQIPWLGVKLRIYRGSSPAVCYTDFMLYWHYIYIYVFSLQVSETQTYYAGGLQHIYYIYIIYMTGLTRNSCLVPDVSSKL